MGTYLNPGNRAFQVILNSAYVDKTGLIDYVNSTINRTTKLTCFTRPRRFGKSFAAKMLCAYYDKSCDSRPLFDNLAISKKASYDTYINKFNVIYLDITWFISRSKTRDENVVMGLQKAVITELRESFDCMIDEDEVWLPDALLSVSSKTGDRFVVIIDEWDALFREAKNNFDVQKEYIELLRGLFKGGTTMEETIAAAYMTGILPIKKYGTESAITDFLEFTMLEPDVLAPYVGFSEPEVKQLCSDYHADFEEMKYWYDGYSFENQPSLYNPTSVMQALMRGKIRNYWSSSETYESLKSYISMNFAGLKDAIISMLGGERVKVNVNRFQNDITSFKDKDDIMTLLIHLGYLGYDSESKKTFIPNQEVADVFGDAVEGKYWEETEALIRDSDDLLDATLKGNSDAVAVALEKAHNVSSPALQYNNETSLRCAILIAYYTARRVYKIVPEFPSGKGFADLAFLPREGTEKPAMIIELKYDKDAETAIRQIHEKRYDGDLKAYYGNLLLVGINYDKNTKKHGCIIERV